MNCTKCGVELHSFLTGKKEIAGEPYCTNCYLDKFGKLVEECPIGGKL